MRRGYGSIHKTCIVCQGAFRISKSEVNTRTGGTCSMDCCRIARRTGLIKAHVNGRPWTEDELQILRDRYVIDGPAAVARRLKRTRGATCCKAAQIGVARIREGRSSRRWTQEENDWLRENYAKYSWPALAKQLGRSKESIRIQAVKLQARRLEGDLWTPSDVAAIFGVTAKCVHDWIGKGYLRSTLVRHLGPQGTHQIHPAAVRAFIFARPLAFDIRKVDQVSFLDVCQGAGIHSDTRHRAEAAS